MYQNKAALIIGAGDSLGSALAKRLAKSGLKVCLVRRNQKGLDKLCSEIEREGGRAYGYSIDATKEQAVIDLFASIEEKIAPLDLVIFNIGTTYKCNISTLTVANYQRIWQESCFAGFLAGREAARVMIKQGSGTIIFTGATNSVISAQGYSAFSGAKFALRALAQSMARELGPKGVHVAHIIVDGAIDSPFMRQSFGKNESQIGKSILIDPQAIAENYFNIYKQPANAWTHELDLRTCTAPW